MSFLSHPLMRSSSLLHDPLARNHIGKSARRGRPNVIYVHKLLRIGGLVVSICMNGWMYLSVLERVFVFRLSCHFYLNICPLTYNIVYAVHPPRYNNLCVYVHHASNQCHYYYYYISVLWLNRAGSRFGMPAVLQPLSPVVQEMKSSRVS